MTNQFYANLHAKAQEVRPPMQDGGPSRILVAVFVDVGLPPNLHDLETEDFGWFNGVATTKMSTLRNKAEQAIVRRYIPEGDWSLRYRGVDVGDSSGSLADFDDGKGLVVFIATKVGSGLPVDRSTPLTPPQTLPARGPFQPVTDNLRPVAVTPAPVSSRTPSLGAIPTSTNGVAPLQATSFIDPFARYPTSPSVRTYSDPPVRPSQFPPVSATPTRPHQPPGASPQLGQPLPPYGVFPTRPPGFVDPVPVAGFASLAVHPSTPATAARLPGPSPQAFPTASPVAIHAPSREASVKSEVAAIVKEELDEQKEPETSPVQLQTLFHDVDVKTMERGVDRGLELLYKLDRALEGAQTEEGKAWLAQIAKIRKQAEFQRCVIGVVGNTGAGKSSVINALLEEERLVPTSCMRACTAVVTEISYNTETDHPYRAKIEFISEADWLKELKALWQDLFDEYGEMRNVSRDADAQVAWEKIKAVYPGKTKETLTKTSPDSLVREPSVKMVLGKTRVLENTDSFKFYKDLQRYVDSAEKSKDDKKPKGMEFWPLIQVVKIFVKSEPLKTGAVVVDLPGVHDANAARAAVADSYMQKCTGLWIVAPITRAVDDKSAHKLLGEGFRRQLLMDGGFSSISFICSKSDDISVSEAILSLQLEEELEPQNARIEELDAEKNAKKADLKELTDTKSDIQDAIDQLDDWLSAWEDIKDKAEAGEVVYEPKLSKTDKDADDKDADKGKKRKRGASPARIGKRKTRRCEEDDADVFAVDDDDDDDEEEQPSDKEEEETDKLEEDEGEPVSLEEIEAKIDELKESKKAARKQKSELIHSITKLKADISELSDSIRKLENEVACRCIKERNAYSTAAIQQDFVAGLRELDLEAAEEQQGDNFDPNIDIRDYDEIAKNLPVFCVSSRGYQKLQGRLKKDGDPPVFQNIEQTGMPDLISFCTKVTEKGRLANGRRFLTSVSQLCNSLTLWSSGAVVQLSADEKNREVQRLNRACTTLDHKLDKGIQGTVKGVKDTLKESIFDRYAEAVNSASTQAPETAEKWGLKVNRADRSQGGLYWATYKAICRRDGVFSNGNGKHLGAYDWNAELTAPLIKLLATHWERVFNTRIPAIVRSYVRIAKDAMLAFHNTVTAQAGPARAAHMHLLSGQLTTHGDAMQAICNEIIEFVNTTQREINREFAPGVQQAMVQAYMYCTNESGSGCFARMKGFMQQHVEQNKRVMFERSVNSIKCRLGDMVKSIEDMIDESTARLYSEISRDYHSVFGGEAKDFSGGQGRQNREIREKVRQALVDFERPFKVVVGLDVEPKAEAKEEDDGTGDLQLDGPSRQISAGAASSMSAAAEDILGEPGPSNTRRRPRVKEEDSDDQPRAKLEYYDEHFPPEADNDADSDFAPDIDGGEHMDRD
ncbi:hypothetical protein FN846DRAFT_910178 [Sphaerosporella brunnea]|uniref:Tat pathway signal sequence n=1 Tax=Sphaerosporella brunnea TaxID=1250544 RepID=A0A5J5EMI7_9PEZI|nr:hypothetical protein FN846DRAFT_910178 [Sphaerosporella brunnea]